MTKKTPRDIYTDIQIQTPPDLDDRVLHAIQQHRGKENTISRRDLIELIFGVYINPDDDLENNTYDRQIRLAISRLQERHVIISSSSYPGYHVPDSMDEVYQCSGELVSRATKLLEKARKLERLALETLGNPTQLRLID